MKIRMKNKTLLAKTTVSGHLQTLRFGISVFRFAMVSFVLAGVLEAAQADSGTSAMSDLDRYIADASVRYPDGRYKVHVVERDAVNAVTLDSIAEVWVRGKMLRCERMDAVGPFPVKSCDVYDGDSQETKRIPMVGDASRTATSAAPPPESNTVLYSWLYFLESLGRFPKQPYARNDNFEVRFKADFKGCEWASITQSEIFMVM